jgi:hypothetical protein
LAYRTKFPSVKTEPEHLEEEVIKFISVFLCDDYKNKEYVRCGEKYNPIVLKEDCFKNGG